MKEIMRTFITILLLSIAVGCVTHPGFPKTRAAAIQAIQPYENRFFDPSDHVDRAHLAPLVAAEFVLGASSPIPPTFVGQMASHQGSNIAVFVHVQQGRIPSAPYVEVLLVDTSGDGPVGRLLVTTGWRTWITGISVLRSEHPESVPDMLVLESHGAPDVVRHYYAVHVPEVWPLPELHLIRIESKGHGTHFLGYGPAHLSTGLFWASLTAVNNTEEPFWPLLDSREAYLGPPVGRYSAEEWCERIENGERPIQLSSLYFLCGQHDMLHPQYAEIASETPRLLLDRGTLLRLQEATNPWVAEYARILETQAKTLANKTPEHISEGRERPSENAQR
jgi:hypothetical protein